MKDLKILGIETSSKIASCGIYDTETNKMLGELTDDSDRVQSQKIFSLCKRLLEDLNMTLHDVDSIAVSKGPGSYTGIRIGLAAVKAIAFAQNKKCYGVSELYALAINDCDNLENNNLDNNILFCGIITARQDLVYCGVYKNPKNKNFETVFEEKICSKKDLNSFLENLKEFDGKIILNGNGAKDFYSEYKNDKYILAEESAFNVTAKAVCESTLYLDEISPEELNALYLQLTEAERNLVSKK